MATWMRGSNKGAPGIDGQDFADVEASGVERWLGELALALRQETLPRQQTEVTEAVKRIEDAVAVAVSSACQSSRRERVQPRCDGATS
jgi:hypothetical protein